MKLFRTRNPKAVEYLKDKLIIDEGVSEETLLNQIEIAMADYPEDTFVLFGLDGNSLKCFLIAYNVPNQSHAFLHQVWCEPGFENYTDRMFFRLLMWAQGLGKKQIRGETYRDSDACKRRWNFKEISKIVAFDIPDDLEEKLLSGNHNLLIGVDTNGQK